MADQAVGDLHDSDDEDEVDLRPSKLRSSYDFPEDFTSRVILFRKMILPGLVGTNHSSLVAHVKVNVTCSQFSKKTAADTG